MKGYSELYLNDARKNLGEMIEYAVVDLGFEPDEFLVTLFPPESLINLEMVTQSLLQVCRA